jgi:8-oxo-dGTP pyrophosphatase MutT (NUDIX family)
LILPEDHARHALLDQRIPPRPRAVRPRHAASLVVYRGDRQQVSILMGMRGAKHRFMPNRLVFPGGAVDHADLDAPSATPLSAQTERLVRKSANARLAHGLAIAASRELEEESGLSLGAPPNLRVLYLLARAVTPPPSPIRFNARFFVVDARHVSGTLGGDGELEGLRYYDVQEALALDLAMPTRRVLERLGLWLAMDEAERAAQTHTPVMHRDRGWRME